MLDALEFPDGFLPDDFAPVLRETAIPLRNHHLILIGRYLAQLHASGLLMRDLSRENVMFRRANGYPVMIDDPIRNESGFAAEVFAADLFTPAVSFSIDQFQALMFGYVLNAQRLLDRTDPGITEAIVARTGAHPVDMVRPVRDEGFARASAALGIEPFAVAGAGAASPSPELSIWTLIVHNLVGRPAPELRSRLSSLGKEGLELADAFEPGHDPFLTLADSWQGPERDFLAGVRRNYGDHGGRFPELLQMQPQFAFSVLVPWMEDPGRRTWARRFGKFWIEALTEYSAALDPREETNSIHCAQIAHVVLQHIPFGDSTAEDLLQTLRCSDSARSWYNGVAGGPEDQIVHLLAFRNTEANTLSKLAFRAAPDPGPRFLHAAIDAIEIDRRLVGHSTRIRRAGILSGGSAEAATYTLQAAVRRLFIVHSRMLQLEDPEGPLPYSYAYDPGLWTREPDEQAEGRSERTEIPESLRELEWAMSTLRLFAADPKATDEVLFDQLGWHEAVYGDSWCTPADKLGPDGFQILIAGDEGKPRALRRGAGQVIYHVTEFEGRPALIMERLHPLPGNAPDNYEGGPA